MANCERDVPEAIGDWQCFEAHVRDAVQNLYGVERKELLGSAMGINKTSQT